MVVWIENSSEINLRLTDYYVWNSGLGVGYPGGISISIGAGKRKSIRSSHFTDQVPKNPHPQKIHVLRDDGGDGDGSPLLILDHSVFLDSKGRTILLKMDEQCTNLIHCVEDTTPHGHAHRTFLRKIEGLYTQLKTAVATGMVF